MAPHAPRRLARALPGLALAALATCGVAACQPGSSPQGGAPPQGCAAGAQPYDGHCISDASADYITCTQGRGFSFSTDDSGGLSGTFRAIVGASVSAAEKKSQQEDTPVALSIVQACLKLAGQSAQVTTDRQAAQQYTGQVDQSLQQWEQQVIGQTPHITLSTSHAAAGDPVTVAGRSFWPHETVDIDIQGILVTQVPADGHGDFTVTITVSASDLIEGFPSSIDASGESSAESAASPFTRTS